MGAADGRTAGKGRWAWSWWHRPPAAVCPCICRTRFTGTHAGPPPPSLRNCRTGACQWWRRRCSSWQTVPASPVPSCASALRRRRHPCCSDCWQRGPPASTSSHQVRGVCMKLRRPAVQGNNTLQVPRHERPTFSVQSAGQDDITSPVTVQRTQLAVLRCICNIACHDTPLAIAGVTSSASDALLPAAQSLLAAMGDAMGSRQLAPVREQATQVRQLALAGLTHGIRSAPDAQLFSVDPPSVVCRHMLPWHAWTLMPPGVSSPRHYGRPAAASRAQASSAAAMLRRAGQHRSCHVACFQRPVATRWHSRIKTGSHHLCRQPRK